MISVLTGRRLFAHRLECILKPVWHRFVTGADFEFWDALSVRYAIQLQVQHPDAVTMHDLAPRTCTG